MARLHGSTALFDVQAWYLMLQGLLKKLLKDLGYASEHHQVGNSRVSKCSVPQLIDDCFVHDHVSAILFSCKGCADVAQQPVSI